MVFGWIRGKKKDSEKTAKPKKMRKVKIDGKEYYADEEKGEFINVKNSLDTIPIYVMGYSSGRKMQQLEKEVI
jgi:hypothetical protein